MAPKKRRADIRDVAREAGVSVATVSHALNDKGRVSQDTRDRVRRIAQELGYRPSASARNLVSKRSGLLGLVVSSSSWEAMQRGTLHYFTQLMMGATTEALRRGYALATLPLEKELGGDIQIDGAIVVDPIGSDPVLGSLRRRGIPYLTTGRDANDSESRNWIDNDHASGAEMVLTHLFERGARRPVLLSAENEISFTKDLEASFRSWCARKGVTGSVRYTQEDSMERDGFEVMQELLAGEDPPDALFAAYSPLAFGAATAAAAAGVRIPEDLLVVTTATDEISNYQGKYAQLTSVDLHPERLGSTAVRLLAAMIDGEVDELPHLVKPDLTIRESTQPAQ